MHDVFVDYSDRPIIVTGCARSGTSLVAGVIHLCGAWIGDCTGPTRWNRKGQFENVVIRDRMTKPYLKSIGCDPLGQDPLPPLYSDLKEPHWRERVLKVIRSQGYDGTGPWLFKGAKACLIWQVWHTAFPDSRWVIVRRETDKIIDSCLKTSFMRKRSSRDSWLDWVDHHLKCFKQMEEAGLNIADVWPGEIIRDGGSDGFQAMISWLGLKFDKEGVTDFLDANLWTGG